MTCSLYFSIVTLYKQTTRDGIQVTFGKVIQTILYADDQVVTEKIRR
jgi:hypothetical protein